MPISYPIPEQLNQTWGGARNWLTELLGNIFDPNQQTQPPAFQGMQEPPKSLPELMASMAINQTPRDAYEGGIMGAGMMPLLVKMSPIEYWKQSTLLTNHQTPFLTAEGRLTNPWVPHGETTANYLMPGRNLDNIGAFMKDTGSIRLSAAGNEINIELLQFPTKTQINKIKQLVGDRKIYWDFSNDKMNIIKSGDARNFNDFIKQIKSIE